MRTHRHWSWSCQGVFLVALSVLCNGIPTVTCAAPTANAEIAVAANVELAADADKAALPKTDGNKNNDQTRGEYNGKSKANGKTGGAYNGKHKNDSTNGLISNVWADVDIRQVLRDIAEQARVTIVPDRTVQGVVSLDIHDLPVEKALDIVCRTGGFAARRMQDGYFLVGSAEAGSPNHEILSETMRIQVKNMQAREILEQLAPSFGQYARADDAHNVLVVTGPPSVVAEIRRIVNVLDIRKPQVVIEAMFAELNDSNLLELDNEIIAAHLRHDAGGQIKLPIGSNPLDIQTLVDGNVLHHKIGETALAWVRGNNAAFAVFEILAQRGRAKVRARPRVTTMSGKAANIFVGNEQYFSVLTGNINYPNTQLKKVEAGIRLTITPYVESNGEIRCELEPEVSDVVGISEENGAPQIVTRRVKTVVQVTDGGTIVLGGLSQMSKRTVVAQIPLLGSIPVLGYLFKSKSNTETEVQTIILIRPHILKAGETDWQSTTPFELPFNGELRKNESGQD